MKVVSGAEVMTMMINGESLENLWCGDPTEKKGTTKQVSEGKGYFTMVPVAGHLTVDNLLSNTLLIVDMSTEVRNEY